MLSLQRGARGSGIAVDPMRVREARLAAGLSLAEIAGDEVSRTFVHFVETGRSRPSRRVLELIARRTGRPVSYFLRLDGDTGDESQPGKLAAELSTVANHVQRFLNSHRLTKSEREAMMLVDLLLHQAAALTRSLKKGGRR